MKKIKLLTGLSTLTILGVTTLPLTSCAKEFDGQVSIQEWKDAIDYLGWNSKQMPYWSFGQDDYALLYIGESGSEEYSLYTYTGWTATPDGVFANCVHKSKDGSTESFDFYEKVYGDIIYSYLYETKSKTSQYVIGTFVDIASPTVLIWIALSSVYDYYDDFTFNANDKHYHYTGALEEYFSVDTQISFNKNKMVDHVSCTLDLKDGRIAKTDFNLNYDKKEITWPEGYDERVKRHIIEYKPESPVINTEISATEQEGLVVFSTTAEDNLRYFRAYKNDVKQSMFKGGKVLVNGEIVSYSVENDEIAFGSPLPKGSNVIMVFYPKLTDGDYTFKWETV